MRRPVSIYRSNKPRQSHPSRFLGTQPIHRWLKAAAEVRVTADAASGHCMLRLEKLGDRRPCFRSLRYEPRGIMDLLVECDERRELIAQLLLDRLAVLQRDRGVLGHSASGCGDRLGVFHPEARVYGSHVPLKPPHDRRKGQLIRLGLRRHLWGVRGGGLSLFGGLADTRADHEGQEKPGEGRRRAAA
jgi:hypothetical protein